MKIASSLTALTVLVALSGDAQSGSQTCDPLSLDSCPAAGEFCYTELFSETNSCAAVGAEPPPQQNELCMFINGCAAGLGCILLDPTESFLTCAHYCDPATGQTAQGGTCREVDQLPARTATCARLDEFYGDVDLSFGMCIDCASYPQSLPCDRVFSNGFEA